MNTRKYSKNSTHLYKYIQIYTRSANKYANIYIQDIYKISGLQCNCLYPLLSVWAEAEVPIRQARAQTGTCPPVNIVLINTDCYHKILQILQNIHVYIYIYIYKIYQKYNNIYKKIYKRYANIYKYAHDIY